MGTASIKKHFKELPRYPSLFADFLIRDFAYLQFKEVNPIHHMRSFLTSFAI